MPSLKAVAPWLFSGMVNKLHISTALTQVQMQLVYQSSMTNGFKSGITSGEVILSVPCLEAGSLVL